MELSALDNGGQLRSMLTNALQNSLAADASYVVWAQGAQSNGCRPSAQRRSVFAEGARRSTAAQKFKKSFLAAWNPVAASSGFPQRTIKQI
jgi:hypothetical protein